VTGLVGETDEELAALCRVVGSIDRRACRTAAETRFAPHMMAGGYEALYRRVAHPAELAATLALPTPGEPLLAPPAPSFAALEGAGADTRSGRVRRRAARNGPPSTATSPA
jgi:hypothetical protein